MKSSKPSLSLLFDVQALSRQNEVARKQSQKRSREVKNEEIVQEQSNKTQAKVKRTQSNGKDIISKRKAAQLALSARAAKSTAKKAAASLKVLKEEVELHTDELELNEAKTPQGAKANQAEKTAKNEQLAKLLATGNLFSEADLLAMAGVGKDILKLQAKAEVEAWPEVELDLDPKKSVLDQLFDPENLIDSTATTEQLADAKAAAKQMARFVRHAMRASFPSVIEGAVKGLTNEGIDLTDPELNPYLLNADGQYVNPNPQPFFAGKKLTSKYFKAENQESPERNKSVDESIFASVFKAIEINQILQELGVESELATGKIQRGMSKDLIQEAETQYSKNADAIKKAHEQKCLSNTLRILGDIVGAMFIVVGLPMIGVPVILASEGQIKKMIIAMAKAFRVPEYVIQSIIVALAAIAATAYSIATLGAGTAMAVGAVLFVAGLVGWVETTVGGLATGQLDPEKFPEWVAWAAMGIEIGLSIATMYQSILSALRSIGKALMALPKTLVNVGRYIMQNSPKFATLARAAQSASKAARAASGAATVAAKATSAFRALSDGLALAAKYAGSSAIKARGLVDSITVKINQLINRVGEMAPKFTEAMNSLRAGSGASSGTSASTAAARLESAITTQVVNPMTQGSSAATRAAATKLAQEGADVAQKTQGVSIAAVSPNAAPSTSVIADVVPGVTKRSQTLLEKMMTTLEKWIEDLSRKLLQKLLRMKDGLVVGERSAGQLAGTLKEAASVAERAERILNSIKKLMRLTQKVAKWTNLAAQGSQAAVQFEMGRVQLEMGDILKEAAELSGEVTLLDQFVKSFNLSLKSINESRKQHGQDSADQLETLGSIVASERRNSNLLMSA